MVHGSNAAFAETRDGADDSRKRKTIGVTELFEAVAPLLFHSLWHVRTCLSASKVREAAVPPEISLDNADSLFEQAVTWGEFLSPSMCQDNPGFYTVFLFAHVLELFCGDRSPKLCFRAHGAPNQWDVGGCASYAAPLNGKSYRVEAVCTEVRYVEALGERAFVVLKLMNTDLADVYIDLVAVAVGHFETTRANGDGYSFDAFVRASRPEYFGDANPDYCPPRVRTDAMFSILRRQIQAIDGSEGARAEVDRVGANVHMVAALDAVRYLFCVHTFASCAQMNPALIMGTRDIVERMVERPFMHQVSGVDWTSFFVQSYAMIMALLPPCDCGRACA